VPQGMEQAEADYQPGRIWHWADIRQRGPRGCGRNTRDVYTGPRQSRSSHPDSVSGRQELPGDCRDHRTEFKRCRCPSESYQSTIQTRACWGM